MAFTFLRRHPDDAVSPAFTDRLLTVMEQMVPAIHAIRLTLENMQMTLDDLKADVTAQRGVIDSAVALIGGFAGQLKTLADQLAASGVDVQAINDLHAQISAATGELAAAVAANTPAAPAPAPAPEPAPAPADAPAAPAAAPTTDAPTT